MAFSYSLSLATKYNLLINDGGGKSTRVNRHVTIL